MITQHATPLPNACPATNVITKSRSQRHATPVELTQITKSVWRGEVVPLPEKISLYYSIRKTTNGTIAIVRNTEFGLFHGSYKVQIDHQAIILRSQSGELQGTYDGATDTLSFSLIMDLLRQLY
jgi:hypothetical protein